MNNIKKFDDYKSLYHGSDVNINTVKLVDKSSGETNFLGDGFYVSNCKKCSSEYGKYTYEVKLNTELESLPYFDDISEVQTQNIISFFSNTNDYDLEYIADELMEKLEDGELVWGKSFISELERYDKDVNNLLIAIGFNSIVAPLNKMNKFLGYSDDYLNINIIDFSIIKSLSKI